jgi:hypothetical protein
MESERYKMVLDHLVAEAELLMSETEDYARQTDKEKKAGHLAGVLTMAAVWALNKRTGRPMNEAAAMVQSSLVIAMSRGQLG